MARDRVYEDIKRTSRLIATAFDFDAGYLQELWVRGSTPCEIMLSVDANGNTHPVRIALRPGGYSYS